MGNSAASRLGSAPFTTGNATTGGAYLGENTHVLVTGELASHDHGVNITSGNQSANHTHSGTTDAGSSHTHGAPQLNTSGAFGGGGISGVVGYTGLIDGSQQTGAEAAHTHTFTSGNQSGNHTHLVNGTSATAGSGTAHNVVSLGILGNWLIRL
jgi:hypothetical protein